MNIRIFPYDNEFLAHFKIKCASIYGASYHHNIVPNVVSDAKSLMFNTNLTFINVKFIETLREQMNTYKWT